MRHLLMNNICLMCSGHLVAIDKEKNSHCAHKTPETGLIGESTESGGEHQQCTSNRYKWCLQKKVVAFNVQIPSWTNRVTMHLKITWSREPR